MQHIVEYDNKLRGCQNCKYLKTNEDDDPCYECLQEPVKEDGKVPVKWVASDEYLAAQRKKEEKEKRKNARRN